MSILNQHNRTLQSPERPSGDSIVGLTEALLEAIRAPIPDIAAISLLLQVRGELLGETIPTSPSERLQRLKLLQEVQSADALVRSRLQERQAQIGEELRLLQRRPQHPKTRPSRSDLLDHRV